MPWLHPTLLPKNQSFRQHNGKHCLTDLSKLSVPSLTTPRYGSMVFSQPQNLKTELP